MKKLFVIAATVLSLSVIFAAGWASGTTGSVQALDQPANVEIRQVPEDCPNCPPEENTDKNSQEKPEGHHKRPGHGYKIKLPKPPVPHDKILRDHP